MRLGARTIGLAAAAGLLLGNLGRVPGFALGGRPGALTLLDAVLVPLWLTLVVTLARGGRRWKLDAFSLWGIAFVAIAALSTLLAGAKWELGLGAHLGVAAFLVRWVLYAGFYLLVVTDPDPDHAGQQVWSALDKAIVGVLIFGLLQSALLPNFGRLTAIYTGFDWDVQGRRLVSTVLDPNFSGGLLLIGLLMRLAQEAEGIRTNRLMLGLFALGLVLTLSRASWLALFCVLPIALLVRGRQGQLLRLTAVGAVATVAAIPAIVAFGQAYNKFEVDVSGLMRFIPWLRSLVLIRDNPVLGVGFNAAGPAQQAYGWELMGGATVSMDGGLLFVAVMTGLAGLIAYCGMLGAFFAAAKRTWRSAEVPPERRAFALGAVMATLGIIVQSLFGNGLLIPWLAMPLWVLQARVVATAPQALPRQSRWRAWRTAAASRAALPGTAALLLLAVSACDPCAGVASCRVDAQRVVAGNIVDAVTQEPRAGVTVRIDALATRSNDAGRWELALPGASDTTVTIDVASPGQPPYRVRDVALRATRVNGDGTQVGVWYNRPVVSYVVGLRRAGVLISGANVRFTVDSAAGGFVYEGVTQDGFVRLAGLSNSNDTIRGTLRIESAALGELEYPRVRIVGEHRVQPDFIRGFFELEGIYRFGGNVQNRGNGVKTPGATVRWQRTSGLQTSPSTVTVTAGADGFFIFDVSILGVGATRGTLTITPPGGGTPYSYTNFRLATNDGSGAQYIGLLGHGEAWWQQFEIRRQSDSTTINNTPWRFTRTGGVMITPSVLEGISDGGGLITMLAAVSDTGTVTGLLELLPAGQPVINAGTISLRTAASDLPQLRPPRYVP